MYLKRNYKIFEMECDMLKLKVELYDYVFSKVNGGVSYLNRCRFFENIDGKFEISSIEYG